MDGEPTTRPPRTGRPPQGPVAWVDSVHVGVLVAVVLVLAVLVGIVLGGSRPSQARTPSAAAPTTPGPAPAPRPATPTATATALPGKPTVPPPPTSAQQAAEEAELRAEAGRLTTPVSLTAPAGWARWGASPATYADDIDGCPHLADRLTAALGTRMSYWQGTLPQGPYGCTWVPVPLSYDGPYSYAYQLDVGWLADGTTAEDLRTGFSEHGNGTTCPGVDVPAAGAGAVLVRCEETTDVEYTLVLRNSDAPGVWLLHAQARDDAAHTPSDALDALVDAVTRAYG